MGSLSMSHSEDGIPNKQVWMKGGRAGILGWSAPKALIVSPVTPMFGRRWPTFPVLYEEVLELGHLNSRQCTLFTS